MGGRFDGDVWGGGGFTDEERGESEGGRGEKIVVVWGFFYKGRS